MPISNLPPIFPVPVLPQSFDTSLSYYELLAKLTESMNNIASTVNSLSSAVTVLQSTVYQIQEQIGDIPELTAAVTQLQTDLAAEVQARTDGYDTLYGQINQVRTLVINEYVDNQTFDATLAGGIKIRLITKTDYDELDPPDASTLYVIKDNDAVSLAFAGAPITQMAAGIAYRSLHGSVNTPTTGTVST